MEDQKKTKKLFTATMASLGALILIFALLQLSIWPLLQPKQVEASIYTPFGGKIESYKPSEAKCVDKIVTKINNKIQNIVRNIVNPIMSPVYASLSAILPWGPAAAAALAVVVNGAIERIKVAGVDELTVGKPTPAKLGVLVLGQVELNFRGVTLFRVNLFTLTGLMDIYRYKKYKTKGVWVLGNSLDVTKMCGEKGSIICNNPIVKLIIKELEDQESEEEGSTADCPLRNLLHQIGTGDESALKKLENIIE